jgi:uncharacterized phage protein (TIGR01671 family)
MNRELKFRVWDKLEKRYLKITPLSKHHYVLDLDGKFHNLQNGSGGNEYVVEQFTGLYDEIMEPIYVGDIIQSYFNPKIFLVQDTKMGYGTVLAKSISYDFDNNPHEHPEKFKHLSEFQHMGRSLTVIGNINENPELLNMKN